VSRSQRTKGKQGEQELARELRGRLEPLGFEVVRGAALQAGQRGSEQAAPDLIVRRKGSKGAGILWIECKRGRKVRIREAIDQAQRESAGTGMTALVIWRDDREPWQLSVPLADGLDLLVEYLQRGEL
jgi:Holliday junction resolvase